MRDKKQFGLDPNKGIVEQLDKEAYKSIIKGAHYVVVVGVSYFHTEILNEMYELGYKFITADRDTKYFEKKEWIIEYKENNRPQRIYNWRINDW